jgi:RNA polymerase sigma-70 factor (ECF subfamily)
MMTRSLVERAQHGDHEAFDALARAAYHRLFAIASRILRDPYAADDAAQDALVRAWRDLRGLRDPDSFDSWLHRLVVNACMDQVRRGKRRPATVHVERLDAPEPADEVRLVADRDELERAFLQLDVEHRTVLVLVHYMGMAPIEVSRTLGIPAGTVHSRLHYGLRRMRALIEADSATTHPEPAR